MLLTHPSSPQAAQALARKLGNAACFIAGGTLLQQSWAERVVQIQADGANLAAVAQALKGFNGRGCGVLGLHARRIAARLMPQSGCAYPIS